MKMIAKKFRNTNLILPILALIFTFTFTSCSEDDDDNTNPTEEGNAGITVRLTDAPGDYDAVYVDVQDVMISSETTEDGEEGWVSVGNVEAGIYNLLDLTGGVTALLADTEIPAGHISQIRLILGPDNSVVIDGGVPITLSTPSAQQSGLKLQVDQTLEADQNYDFLLDFDVEESIVITGNGQFILKPTIRLAMEEATGTITGLIHPTDVQSMVAATNASTSISAYTNSEGEFSLNGVPAGTYQITITPDAESGLTGTVINDVEVSTGETVNLETIFLE